MYTKVNIVKIGDNPGTGGNKKQKVTIIDADDVLSWPAYATDAHITDNIVMKPGTYAVDVYCTIKTLKSGNKSEGDPDQKGIKQNLEFSYPGSPKEIKEFCQYWVNKNVYVITHKCSDATMELFGTPCAPLQLNFSADDDADKNVCVFTLESTNKGPKVSAIYEGTITYSSVTGTVAADATSIDLTNGTGRYQLTDNTVASPLVPVVITTCTNAVNGLVFTLVGSGGSNPSQISAANDFILANGAAWTAISGAEITFKAFKTGVSSWKFIEQSRA